MRWTSRSGKPLLAARTSSGSPSSRRKARSGSTRHLLRLQKFRNYGSCRMWCYVDRCPPELYSSWVLRLFISRSLTRILKSAFFICPGLFRLSSWRSLSLSLSLSFWLGMLFCVLILCDSLVVLPCEVVHATALKSSLKRACVNWGSQTEKVAKRAKTASVLRGMPDTKTRGRNS